MGKTKQPTAYDALLKLLAAPSWREKLQAAALSGLAETGDKRALELGLRYAGPEHSSDVRRAAVRLLGTVGRNDPRSLPVLLQTLRQCVATSDIALGMMTAQAIYELDDEQGLQQLHSILVFVNKLVTDADLRAFTAQVEERLRQKQAPPPQKPAQKQSHK